jgi:hypothetical protein
VLDHFRVPYVRLTFSGDEDGGQPFLVNYGFALDVADISLGPVMMKNTSFSFMKLAGPDTSIKVYRSSTIRFGKVDVIASFQINHSAEEIEATIDADGDEDVVVSNTHLAVELNFPNTRPTITMMLEALLGALTDLTIWTALPLELYWMFDSIEFRSTSMNIEAGTPGWTVTSFYLDMDLRNIGGSFSILGTAFVLQIPQFSLLVVDPTKKDTRSVAVKISAYMEVAKTLCDLSITITDEADSDTLGIELSVLSGKLLFFDALLHFLHDALEAGAASSLESILGPLFLEPLWRSSATSALT